MTAINKKGKHMIRTFTSISACCFLFAVSAGASANHTDPRITTSTKLQHTTITPHLEEVVTVGNNVLYCAAFQTAWNMMQDEVIKGKILLETDPLSAKLLNKQCKLEMTFQRNHILR